MNRIPHCLLLILALAGATLLSACASRGEPGALYDFGPLPLAQPAAAPVLKALVVTDATGPAVLDNQGMMYRLLYADPLQARAYANNRWSSPPLQLLSQRIKTRVAQAGIKVLSVTDASAGVLLLRIEVDEFSHNFTSTSQNHGHLVLRASLFQGHQLLDQKTFDSKVTSSQADAAGGARALAAASDAVASDLIGWLNALAPRP